MLSSIMFVLISTFNLLLLVSSSPVVSKPSFEYRIRQRDEVAKHNDSSCESISLHGNVDDWKRINMDDHLKQFQDMWDNDLLWCQECFGKKQDDCDPKYFQNCQHGIKGETKVNGKGARWDEALQIYAGVHGTDECGIGSPCKHDQCQLVNNDPVGFLLMRSLANLAVYADNAWEAYTDAAVAITNAKIAIADTFAPKPENKDEKVDNEVITSAISSLIGMMPGIGSIAGAAFGLVNGAMSKVKEEQDKHQEDTVNLEDQIFQMYNVSQIALGNGTSDLFQNGVAGQDGKMGKMAEMLKEGGLLTIFDNPTALRANLKDGYVKVMIQQLVYDLWTTLSKEDIKPDPFIFFAPGDCSSLDYKSDLSVPFDDQLLDQQDIGITYNNTCYWLAKLVSDQEACTLIQALPGGTNKELSDNSQHFSGLSLADIIIPSVDGWAKNNNVNGFKRGGDSGGSPTGNVREAGLLNVPVCDYMRSKTTPGVGCPIYGAKVSDSTKDKCPLQDKGASPDVALIEQPLEGGFSAGTCKVSWQLFAPSQFSNVQGANLFFNGWQMMATITDADNKVVGNAAKQFMRTTWELDNSHLPYNLYIKSPKFPDKGLGDPEKRLEFWYGDLHWLSNNNSAGHNCDEGGWDSHTTGIATGHCSFDCPQPGDGAKKEDATKKNPNIDGGLQNPLPFGPLAHHEFINIRQEPSMPPRQIQDEPYDSEYCWLRVTQYNKGKDNSRTYQYQAYLGWDDGKEPKDQASTNYMAEDWNAQVPVTDGPQPIYGLRSSLNVTFGPAWTDAMHFYYQYNKTFVWDWHDYMGKGKDGASQGNFSPLGCEPEFGYGTNTEARQVWCQFKCDGLSKDYDGGYGAQVQDPWGGIPKP